MRTMNTTVHQLYPDIWQHVFEYFNAKELLFSFENLTEVTNELLMSSSSSLLFRGLVLDVVTLTLPERIQLNQVCSLELHQENLLDVIEQCTALRSLKLTGASDWTISVLRKVSRAEIKVERLILILPDVGSLSRIFNSIKSISSLLRFEVYANESKEKTQMNNLAVDRTNIRQFILHSCSSIRWSDMSYILPALMNIDFLDISLFEKNKTNFLPFNFPKLTQIRLIVHELPLETLFELIATTPALTKLKINGLVGDKDFLIDTKWYRLFCLCSSLNTIIVNLSLQESTDLFHGEIIQASLNRINLALKCLDYDDDDFSIERYRQRWWRLSGMIMKHQILSQQNTRSDNEILTRVMSTV